MVSRAEKEGILAWRLDLPISALTHPKMFTFFQTKRDQFLFVHMVDTNQLIIFNHRAIHERVMLPWVKCALTEEVIGMGEVNSHESSRVWIGIALSFHLPDYPSFHLSLLFSVSRHLEPSL